MKVLFVALRGIVMRFVCDARGRALILRCTTRREEKSSQICRIEPLMLVGKLILNLTSWNAALSVQAGLRSVTPPNRAKNCFGLSSFNQVTLPKGLKL